MWEGLETADPARARLDRVTRVLVAQAFALDEMFYSAAREAFSSKDISYYHARKALKAQARCRATFKILLALRQGAAAEKFPNLNEGTIQKLKIPDLPISYPSRAIPVLRLRHKGLPRLTRDSIRRRARWSPERRARQALAIRNWQPWRKSTGPRSEDGKARSARNALKHGLRSKAHAALRREDRRLLSLSADNIATAKAILRASFPGDLSGVARRAMPEARRVIACAARNLGIAKSVFATISDKCERPIPSLSHSIDIGSPTRALIPSRPRITRESPPGGTPPPVTTAIPRRGWRIAS